MILPHAVLVDTSVWIDHLARAAAAPLPQLLEEGVVATHPFVIGELACGSLPDRDAVLGSLAKLRSLPMATDPEVLAFIERRSLMDRGIGYVDAHLLASVVLRPSGRLWTRDRRLRACAKELGVAHDEA